MNRSILSRILQKKTNRKLNKNFKILKNYTEILKKHTEILKNHTEILKNHTEILKNHTEEILILKEKITKDIAKAKALKSAIKITTINGTANAVLIKHPKLGLIAATNKHVVETSNNSCYDRIIDLRLLDSNIELKSKKIYISKIEDLAIIELEFDKFFTIDIKFKDILKISENINF